MKTSSRKHSRSRSRFPLLATAAAAAVGVGIVVTSNITASAALTNTVPVFVQTGSANLPSGTASISLTSNNNSTSSCKAVSGSSIDMGVRVGEADSMNISVFSDGGCQSLINTFSLTASYNGPAPTNSGFTKLEVSPSRSLIFVCTDGGWTDGSASACRQV